MFSEEGRNGSLDRVKLRPDRTEAITLDAGREVLMKGLLAALGRVSAWMNVIGGGILILMMLLTAADVI